MSECWTPDHREKLFFSASFFLLITASLALLSYELTLFWPMAMFGPEIDIYSRGNSFLTEGVLTKVLS